MIVLPVVRRVCLLWRRRSPSNHWRRWNVARLANPPAQPLQALRLSPTIPSPQSCREPRNHGKCERKHTTSRIERLGIQLLRSVITLGVSVMEVIRAVATRPLTMSALPCRDTSLVAWCILRRAPPASVGERAVRNPACPHAGPRNPFRDNIHGGFRRRSVPSMGPRRADT
jgi:hypothetical protein